MRTKKQSLEIAHTIASVYDVLNSRILNVKPKHLAHMAASIVIGDTEDDDKETTFGFAVPVKSEAEDDG